MVGRVVGLVRGNAVAVLALLVALGGTSYAVAQLPQDSVTAVQIKAGAVRSAEVRDRSLLAKDFRTGQLPAGARGPAGRSALTELETGETVRGTVSADYQVATVDGGDWRVGVSFPVPGSSAPTNMAVDGATPGETCTGSVLEPTAPAGLVCVYLETTSNPDTDASFHPVAGSRFGFEVMWIPTGSGDTSVRGTYAYTQG